MNRRTPASLSEYYEFLQILNDLSEDDLLKFKTKNSQKFSSITATWTDALNSEWTARMFLAAKMIYSSTLLLNTLDYSEDKNVRITSPYLQYYALLNSCRALLFTHPLQDWKNGELKSQSHKAIINNTHNVLSQISSTFADEVRSYLLHAKEFRELHSYQFPGDGLIGEQNLFEDINLYNTIDKCAALCDIAQLTSETLEKSFNKNCSEKTFGYDEATFEQCFIYGKSSFQQIDIEDWQRIGSYVRKTQRPYCIVLTMTAGMTDNFFGNWLAPDEQRRDDVFNPDRRTVKIFDIP